MDKVVMWAARSPTAKTLTRLTQTRRLARQVEDGFVMTPMRWTSVLFCLAWLDEQFLVDMAAEMQQKGRGLGLAWAAWK
eukprot:3682439-Pleurochrysis_carterae.AAC.1